MPPARASHFHAAPAVLPERAPDDVSLASNVASLASVSSPVSALLPASALTGSHTRRDVASPATVSTPWWWARSCAAAIVQSSRALISIAIPASDGGLKLFVELPLPALPLHPSVLAASSVVNGIPHSCCCGATRQHLWFEQMKGYP